jgi:hypothetical protein
VNLTEIVVQVKGESGVLFSLAPLVRLFTTEGVPVQNVVAVDVRVEPDCVSVIGLEVLETDAKGDPLRTAEGTARTVRYGTQATLRPA